MNFNFRYDGFVILHGTDTLCYTASALSFMLQNLGKLDKIFKLENGCPFQTNHFWDTQYYELGFSYRL